jgi:hypothetical protein
MAAASVAAKRSKTGKEPAHSANTDEPVSFHLAFLLGNNYSLPDGKNSVDVLRMPFHSAVSNEGSAEAAPTSRKITSLFDTNFFTNKSSNLTETKTEFWTKKYSRGQFTNDEDKAWQDRLVIVTEKRFFIVTKKLFGNGSVLADFTQPSTDVTHRLSRHVDLEILDSIPVEEIDSIRLERTTVVSENADSADRKPLISTCFGSAAALLTRAGARDDPVNVRSFATGSFVSRTPEQQQGSDRTGSLFRQKAIRSSSSGLVSEPKPSTIDGYCEPILKIATKPGGFNRGQSYHFLLR